MLLASGDIENGINLLKEAWTENEEFQPGIERRVSGSRFRGWDARTKPRLAHKAERLDPQCRQWNAHVGNRRISFGGNAVQ